MSPPGYATNGIYGSDDGPYFVLIYNAGQCRGLAHPPLNLDISVQVAMEEWMVENCPSRHRDDIEYTTAFWRGEFDQYRDALAFFLTWG